MAGFALAKGTRLFLRSVILKTVQCYKIFIGQLRMGQIYIMVGKGDDRIAMLLIQRLGFCRCEFTVGTGGVAVQICFVKMSLI